jgi:hypothetical protein
MIARSPVKGLQLSLSQALALLNEAEKRAKELQKELKALRVEGASLLKELDTRAQKAEKELVSLKNDREAREAVIQAVAEGMLNPYCPPTDAHYDHMKRLRESLTPDEQILVRQKHEQLRQALRVKVGKPTPDGEYGLFAIETGSEHFEEGPFVGVAKGDPIVRFATLNQAGNAWQLMMTEGIDSEWGPFNRLTIRQLLDGKWENPQPKKD